MYAADAENHTQILTLHGGAVLGRLNDNFAIAAGGDRHRAAAIPWQTDGKLMRRPHT